MVAPRTVAKKFSIEGAFAVLRGGFDIIQLTKTPRFNLRVLVLFGGVSPPKPPWRRDWLHHQTYVLCFITFVTNHLESKVHVMIWFQSCKYSLFGSIQNFSIF